MPGYHSYNLLKEVQTYDVTAMLEKENVISFMLGDGWYKGRFVFDGGEENIYGDTLGLIYELHIDYEDGTCQVITSNHDMKAYPSMISSSSIYDGEVMDDLKEPIGYQDYTYDDTSWLKMISLDIDKSLLVDRYNVEIFKQDAFKVKEVIL